ncbi:MAG: protease pro-enzyme activation domain-containing protein [Bryobacteraceae bacterium]|jgi:subtilase family serine protease
MKLSQANIRRLSVALTMGALVALGLLLYTPVFGDYPRVLITKRIDETQLVRLWRNTRPEANPKFDRGRVDDNFAMPQMMLQLKRSPQLEAEFAQFTESLTDKNSPNFRHWMLADEQGEKFGVAQEDIDTVSKWLESHGFSIDGVQPNKMVISFSGTAGNIREAFHTEIHNLYVHGEHHFANMSDPKIPRALAPAVVGVVAMHDFKPHPHLVPRGNYTFSGCGSNCYALVPADFQTIYNLNPLYRQGINGKGQTITVVESSATYSTDVATYRSTFLSGYTGTVTPSNPSGGSACTNATNAADGEADLDAEIASAMAPNATIVVAICSQGPLNAVQNLVNSVTPPSIISMSYGECEAFNGATANASYNTAFHTGATAGVSIFVSTGDEGSSTCENLFGAPTDDVALPGLGVTGWGETIYNVAVGGTDFMDEYNALEGGPPISTYWSSTNTSKYGSAKSYIPEIPWNDSCAGYLITNLEGYAVPYGTGGFCNSTIATTNNAFISAGAASGGASGCATGGGGNDQLDEAEEDGTCAGYAKPSFQSGIFGNPADGVRDIPDVSMFASNGFWGHYMVTCFSDTTNGGTSCAGAPSTWSGFGGTSVATPMMASVQALVNEKWGLTKVGNPNPTYYSIANAEFGPSGNSNCYSINQPGRRGLQSSCVFNDITAGDIDVVCKYNGNAQSGCYAPPTAAGVAQYGAESSQPPALTISAPGSGYSSAPTCAIGGVSPYTTPYLSPTNGTIYAGGQAATCSTIWGQVSTLTNGTKLSSSTCTGKTVTVGGTTYTCVFDVAPTAVNQFEGCAVSGCASAIGGTTGEESATMQNLMAVINANPQQCADVSCVFTGQTANTSASAYIVSTTGSGLATNKLTLGALTNGGTFTVSSTSTGITAATPTTTGVANVSVSGLGGYSPGQPVTCTLSGASFTTAATCGVNLTFFTPAPGYAPAWGATPGWDFATGLGSVNAYNLVMNTAW